MARFWALFHGAGWHGQAPMFLFQMLLYWTGLGLFAAVLARQGSRAAAAAVLLLGHLAAYHRLAGGGAEGRADGGGAACRHRPCRLEAIAGPAAAAPGAALLVGLLLLYATLVRINAVFATVPLAFGLLGQGSGGGSRCGAGR